jgi:hypothetical protein
MIMPSYRLHYLNTGNRILNDMEHFCGDDLAALDRARGLSKDHAIEIWQEKRRVALVKRGDAALDAGDPCSL